VKQEGRKKKREIIKRGRQEKDEMSEKGEGR
jgi:hypothetical protein